MLLIIESPKNEGYRIRIPASEHAKFIGLISPHILPMFRYKVDYGAYVEWRKAREAAGGPNDPEDAPAGSEPTVTAPSPS